MAVEATHVDRYEMLGEIATGGMATVYLARQRGPFGFARTVAIKSMHPHYARDPEFRAMFLDEATLTARIRHPNVVPTLDIVCLETNVLLVMEYVDGVALSTLARRAKQRGMSIEPAIASAVICDLLHGLHAAHNLKDDDGRPLSVVHRDVSPQNIHVGADGLTRVLDFGIAKAASRRHVTQGNEVKGKLAYMSSEQLCGEFVDHRTDVYAAGVVLWETVTGQRLIGGKHEGEMVREVLDPHFMAPSKVATQPISPELDAVIMRALSVKTADRWESADAMASALSAAVPPAPRNKVSALVIDLAATEIESRAERLRSSSVNVAPEAKVIAEVLTHATVTRAANPTTNTVPPPEAAKKRPIAILLAGAVLVAAAIVGAFVVGSRTTRPVAPVIATPAPPPAASSVPPPATAPIPLVIIDPSVSVPTPAPVPAPAPAPAPPAKGTKKGGAPAGRPKPDCRVPYVVDANGDRHYRPECVE